jgi:hypothetical protein
MVWKCERKITKYFDGVKVELKTEKFNTNKANIDVQITNVVKSNNRP